MFNVYSNGVKITENTVSYNHLLTMFRYIEIPWPKVSELPLGDSVTIDHIIIVREV